MTTPAIEPVEIAAEDGVNLRGQLRDHGKAWIILLHDVGKDEDLDCWSPLDAALASRDWSVLSADLRGHGASDGEWDPANAPADIAAIVADARSRGASFLAVAAAGASAIYTLRSAQDVKADALILLSPALEPDQPLSDLRGTGEAKLIVVGGADPVARSSGERLCKAAIGWVMLLNLPSGDRGTALLSGLAAPHLTEHICRFLGEQRHLARLRTRAPGAAAPNRAGTNPVHEIASTDGVEHS